MDRLRNQSGGIREVDEPCMRTELLHDSCLLDSDGNCTQCHRDSAWSSRLLTRITMDDRSSFVMRSCLDSANSNTIHNKGSTIDGILKRGSFPHAKTTTFAGNNGPAKLGHNADPVTVRIKKNQLLRT
jgi:hypothetical protein